MRGRRIKTLLFYAVLLYFFYRLFLAGDEEPLPQQPIGPDLPQLPAETDSNIIVRMLSFLLSIVPWAFSCIWSLLGLLWGVVCWLWGVIGHVWTIAMLVANMAYGLIVFHITSRSRRKSVEYFVEAGTVYLLVPLVANWLLLRREIALNLLLPVYLTVFVASTGEAFLDATTPRNLVFFVAVCALL